MSNISPPKKSPINFKGEFLTGSLHLQLYATDASVYRELPYAVAVPRHEKDVVELVRFAQKNKLNLTPRGTGTSLAGQCVTSGIVVDMSKFFTNILHLDVHKKQVTVQPGVIRDELNTFLAPYGLHFGPNTSTSNRCTIGGMFGNNSSGTTSIKYGVTRDKVVSAKVVLSDASVVNFATLSNAEVTEKTKLTTLEGEIYKGLLELLRDKNLQQSIQENYPHPDIHRRNTGYALDALLDSQLVDPTSDNSFNLCKLLAGSEGTLGLATEITLLLDDLPPKQNRLIAAQFHSVEAALESVQKLMEFPLYTCELMDYHILDCTKDQAYYKEHRFFLEAEPKAVLLLEYRAEEISELLHLENKIIECLQNSTQAYAFPVLVDKQIDKAMELRKAGLGLLGNMNGDKKAVACIEDTAVRLEDFASYINEFTALMKELGQEAVYYAHAGAGELHLRPILDLKLKEDRILFQEIAHKVALLVKKYKGALSGEHGDGRVRSNFIPLALGEECYQALIKTKHLFDRQNIFNPSKIVHSVSMLKDLRYAENQVTNEVETLFKFNKEGGILRAAEKCNGSGDCRKTHHSSGGMCPSFHVTKNEKDTTRGRANVLREVLTNASTVNQFDNESLKEVFDLCVSCKACKSECPSSVDVAAFKAEFLYQYYKTNQPSFADWLVANNTKINSILSIAPRFSNYILNSTVGNYLKTTIGFAKQRSLPKLGNRTFNNHFKLTKKKSSPTINSLLPKVYFFLDEFTAYYDVKIGIDAYELLTNLGYEVAFVKHAESGRSHISKGFLEKAKALAAANIEVFSRIETNAVIVGIEPSAILSFRDEYLRMHENEDEAKSIAECVFLIEEFIANEFKLGNISTSSFNKEKQQIKAHVHCHQKALGSIKHTFDMLSIPENYQVTIISSGCCGMAGSFGYEEKHYEISQQMAELSLFPSIRKAEKGSIIAANGTSCRHQIKDGVGVEAKHPVSILREAMKIEPA